jgi:hypothetical protein
MASHRHSHVVARGSLKAWAKDGKVGVRWVDKPGPNLLPPAEIAVRSGFYRERRADGAVSDWLDPAMGKLEAKALPLLPELDERWPLPGSDRAIVAEYVALQYVRSPAWRTWHDERALPNARRAFQERHGDELTERVEPIVTSDRERHMSMIRQTATIGTAVINMHWTLLRCGAPRLATSDHPLVPIPAMAVRETPAAITSSGFMNTIELRLAVSPKLLLLMTWLDDYDQELLTRLSFDQVQNHNSVVTAQAEHQWFHHPDYPPRVIEKDFPALSLDLYSKHRYDGISSRRRHATQQLVDDMVEAPEPRQLVLRQINWSGTANAA